MNMKVETTQPTRLYRARSERSPLVAELPAGTVLSVGCVLSDDGVPWADAVNSDGVFGYTNEIQQLREKDGYFITQNTSKLFSDPHMKTVISTLGPGTGFVFLDTSHHGEADRIWRIWAHSGPVGYLEPNTKIAELLEQKLKYEDTAWLKEKVEFVPFSPGTTTKKVTYRQKILSCGCPDLRCEYRGKIVIRGWVMSRFASNNFNSLTVHSSYECPYCKTKWQVSWLDDESIECTSQDKKRSYILKNCSTCGGTHSRYEHEYWTGGYDNEYGHQGDHIQVSKCVGCGDFEAKPGSSLMMVDPFEVESTKQRAAAIGKRNAATFMKIIIVVLIIVIGALFLTLRRP